MVLLSLLRHGVIGGGSYALVWWRRIGPLAADTGRTVDPVTLRCHLAPPNPPRRALSRLADRSANPAVTRCVPRVDWRSHGNTPNVASGGDHRISP
jgi:hypothetical protein